MTDGRLPRKVRNIAGLTVSCLKVLTFHGSDGKKAVWNVQCLACNRVIKMQGTEFMKRYKKDAPSSCGCMRDQFLREQRTTHGMSRHPAFAVWRSMLDRCRLPSHQAYKNYGGRGISVCDRWQRFEEFWADMGPTYQPGLTLDRKDNDGHYQPGNCRWIDRRAQANNRRNSVIIDGKPLSQISAETGIGMTTLYYRLANKWPKDKLLIPPSATNRCTTS